jgi:hypothetical protein
MKSTSKLAAFLKILPLLLMLGAFALWSGGNSYAQAPEPTDANRPAPAAQGTLPSPVFDPSEPNGARPGAPRDHAAARPDLVITDPNADVIAEVERLTGASAGNILAIPAAAFVPDGSGRQWGFGFNNAYLYPAGAGSYCGIAPVYLPNGATVTGVISYVYDYFGDDDVYTYLFARPIGSTTLATTMAIIATSGQSTSIQSLITFSITQPVINNSSYTYHLGVCLWGTNDTMRFYAAQIMY